MKKAVLLLLILGAAAFIFREELGEILRSKKVPADIMTRDWSRHQVGDTDLFLDLPASPRRADMEIPPEVQHLVENADGVELRLGGLEVLAYRIQYQMDGEVDLDGALEGMINEVRQMHEVAGAELQKQYIRLAGRSGREGTITARARDGDEYTMNAVACGGGQTAYLVLAVYRSDQALGGEAWQRIKESINFGE